MIGLDDVRRRVAAAASRAGRDLDEISLIGVSKYTDADGVAEAYAAGLRDFGENRADALTTRAAALPEDARWHFIGRLQGNKVRLVRPQAHVLHSLDRPDLVGYWVKGPGRPPPVLVQVNIGREAQKAGAEPEDAGSLVTTAVESGLTVMGLMAIPPVAERAEDSRVHFAALRELRDRIAAEHPDVQHLSMGMTDDFEVAIEEGATMLRVGRAIFRPSPNEE